MNPKLLCLLRLMFENLREEVYSLFLHLHNSDFLHKSTHTRNILVQPGPLTRPPIERSSKTPSFRLIDFGRTERLEDYTSRAGDVRKGEFEFAMACRLENRRIQDALKVSYDM